MDRSSALDLAERIVPAWRSERERLDRIDGYMRGQHDRPYRPSDAGGEHRRLEERSVSNWLPLVVKAVGQALFVEGYRSTEDVGNAKPWATWQANGLDARQGQLHRSALTFGMAYAVVLPGDPLPVIRGVSARKMLALYADQAGDDWPLYAVQVETSTVEGESKLMVRVYTETEVHFLSTDPSGSNPTWIESRKHNLGVVPVVRFPCELDLDGRYVGEVEPLMRVQDRINQITFDTNLVQSFGSMVIRTISGMSLPEGTTEAKRKKIEMAADRFLVADDPDTKFGSIPGTPLDGYVRVREQAINDLAAQSQTPPHHLLGQMSNLSAEALAAAESSLMRKAEDRRHTFGEAWEQTLRLAAYADGDLDGWEDYGAQVVWRDTEARSLSQTVDALGKAAEMLGLPVEMLWPRIPGFTSTDVEQAKAIRAKGDSLGLLAEEMRRQMTSDGDAEQP